MKSTNIPKIIIIDYGMGNLSSVQNALNTLDVPSRISRDPKDLLQAEGLILPGVGAFGLAMDNLNKFSLQNILNELVLQKKVPLLGICLGMQLFADSSNEMGVHKGLGWISGTVDSIDAKNRTLSVPHVGWNNNFSKKSDGLFKNIIEGAHFYFDHSYHFKCKEENVLSHVEYGDKLVSAVCQKNIYGVQFHPEKSQTMGLKLLRNFINIVAAGEKAC